jgi:hypothetical protein
MKETKIGSAAIREHPGIYERRFLGDRDLFIVLDGEEVHLPSLLGKSRRTCSGELRNPRGRRP